MKSIRVIAWSVTVAMAATIIYGILQGDFSADFESVRSTAWGRVALVDLYLGLILFGAWIWLREQGSGRVWLWWLALITLGNLAAGAYLVRAGFQSRDVEELLLGRRR